VVGACILPFCTEPQHGRIYFLLGKERQTNKWMRASELWSAFGGRPLSRSESAEETAAREFVEESSCMVKFFAHDRLPRTAHADIADALKRREFKFSIRFATPQPPGAGTKVYVVFVCQIPWDPECLNRFHAHRRAVLRRCALPPSTAEGEEAAQQQQHPALSRSDGLFSLNKDYMEMQQLGLWSIPQLLRAVHTCGILSTRGGRAERCRASFTQHAAAVLGEFAFSMPSAGDVAAAGLN
jgi:hypothetical protein